MICGLEFGGMPGCLHKFRLYAAGSGMLLFECRVSGIGNAKGCGIGSMVMLRGLQHRFHRYAKGCGRFHRYTRGSGLDVPFRPLNANGSGIRYARWSGIDSIGMLWGLA